MTESPSPESEAPQEAPPMLVMPVEVAARLLGQKELQLYLLQEQLQQATDRIGRLVLELEAR